MTAQRDEPKEQLADATRPKLKRPPPPRPTPDCTNEFHESTWERLVYNLSALLLIIMLACLAVLAVWVTWQIVTNGCTLLRK